jgi:hypothetical protein
MDIRLRTPPPILIKCELPVMPLTINGIQVIRDGFIIWGSALVFKGFDWFKIL